MTIYLEEAIECDFSVGNERFIRCSTVRPFSIQGAWWGTRFSSTELGQRSRPGRQNLFEEQGIRFGQLYSSPGAGFWYLGTCLWPDRLYLVSRHWDKILVLRPNLRTPAAEISRPRRPDTKTSSSLMAEKVWTKSVNACWSSDWGHGASRSRASVAVSTEWCHVGLLSQDCSSSSGPKRFLWQLYHLPLPSLWAGTF